MRVWHVNSRPRLVASAIPSIYIYTPPLVRKTEPFPTQVVCVAIPPTGKAVEEYPNHLAYDRNEVDGKRHYGDGDHKQRCLDAVHQGLHDTRIRQWLHS